MLGLVPGAGPIKILQHKFYAFKQSDWMLKMCSTNQIA